MSAEKKMFTTRLDKETIKKLKILSVHHDKPIDQLIKEAVVDLLKKYQSKK